MRVSVLRKLLHFKSKKCDGDVESLLLDLEPRLFQFQMISTLLS